MTIRLFHSTPNKFRVIEPRWQHTCDGTEGNFVFAQPDEVIAHAYALKTGACFQGGGFDWVHSIASPDRGDWENELPRNAKGQPGGFIHEVDPTYFREVCGREWVSETAVPIDPAKTCFVSVDDCMIAGVQLFIIRDTERFCWKLPLWRDHPATFIMDAVESGGIRWLNQERQKNPIPAYLPPNRQSLSHAPVTEAIHPG